MAAFPFPAVPFHTQRDPFTGLGDELAFLTQLDQALARAVETARPLAVLQLDLDAFAELNDTRGREAGDETILRVTGVLRDVGARHDFGAAAFRLGGDDFALLLPGVGRKAAREIAARILGHESLSSTSLSIGIGVAEPGRADLGWILLAAGTALARAKEQGGGRAVLFEGGMAAPEQASGLIERLARSTISTGRRLDEAYYLALTDPVTGLPNQRALYQFLEAEMPRAVRHGHTFALLLVDGDNLKAYNERLGYAGGDEWIRTLGALLVRETRASDLTVRWRSGDEFIVALPETTRNAARLLAERLRKAVERISAQLPLPVTVSIGVAAFPDDAATADDLLARVEEANQRAKIAGKNRVAAITLDEAEAH